MKIKRMLSTFAAAALFFSQTAFVHAEESTACKLNDITVVMDGTRYKTKAYINASDSTVYVSGEVFKKLFGAVPEKTFNVGGTPFAELKSGSRELGAASYEYDGVLDSVYIRSESFDTYGSDEIDLRRAEYYGLTATSDKNATYSSIMKILDSVAGIAAPDRLEEWQGLSDMRALRENGSEALCLDAAMMTLRLASFLGGEYCEFNVYTDKYGDLYADKLYKELEIAERESLFDDRNEPYYWGGFERSKWIYDEGHSLLFVAPGFVTGKQSMYSRELLFGFDREENTIHLDKPISEKTITLAGARLLDSVKKVKSFTLDPSDKKIRSFEPSIITPELIASTADMPDISSKNPPDFKGVVYTFPGEDELWGIDSFEEQVKMWSEWGFNAVRINTTYLRLFSADASVAYENEFMNLDRAIALAMKYKLHANICLYAIPGQNSDLSNIYEIAGDDRLIFEPEKQKQAELVWNTIAARYSALPNSVLSFSPLMELTSTSFDRTEHYGDIANAYAGITAAIKKERADRYVMWECPVWGFPVSETEQEITGDQIKDFTALADKFENLNLSYNFCESPFVYAHMTLNPGEHIDNCNRAMYLAKYPTVYYTVQPSIRPGEPLILKGDLLKGSTIQFNIWQIWCDDDSTLDFSIVGDGETLYEEKLAAAHEGAENEIKVGPYLSSYTCYRDSDKSVKITLDKDYEEIVLKIGDVAWTEVRWCGMKVTLPEEYAVSNMFRPSPYEWYLEHGEPYSGDMSIFDPYMRPTSEIIISPRERYDGTSSNKITINKNITFSTELKYVEANTETINTWGRNLVNASPLKNITIRFEGADFSGEYFSSIDYYEDILNMCEKNGISWFSNDFDFGNYVFIAKYHEGALNGNFTGSTNIPYKTGYLRKEMFEMYQKHLPITEIPVPDVPEEFDFSANEAVLVYRLYNSVNQEHLFTTDKNEVRVLVTDYGWNYEGSAWSAPETGTPVYRLYCSATNAHLFTSDTNERDTLLQNPIWSIDNGGEPLFYSAKEGIAIYRVYNEGIQRHLLTTNKAEYDFLTANGWNGEDVKFYCSALGDPNEELPKA